MATQRGKNYAVECPTESPVKENKGAETWWYSTIFFFVCWAKSSISSFLMFYTILGFLCLERVILKIGNSIT